MKASGLPTVAFVVVQGASFLPSMARMQVPTDLTVEDRIDPIGIGDPTPEFAWLPQDDEFGAVQSAYQILAASSLDDLSLDDLSLDVADKWDSGRVSGSSVAFVTYAGTPLRSREVCYWKVRTWDGKGWASPYSEPARFEMGLLSNADWDAKWIWRDSDAPDDYTYFRKALTIEGKELVRARVYLSAVHRYEFYINGRLVAKGPNFAYPEHQYYQSLAIEPFLQPGRENVLGLLCHWYGAGQGRPPSRRGLIFKAVIDYADGSSTVVGSDGTWKVLRGEWQEGAGDRNGEGVPAEWIDGRGHPTGWNLPDYNDRDWANAVEIGRHPTPPWTGGLRAQETAIIEYEIAPVWVTQISPRRYVADFGKVYAGMPKITFRNGRPGTVVPLSAGYRLKPDGTVVSSAQHTDMTYRYVLRGGEETFRPYWYLGFRYLQVDDSPNDLDASSLRMIVRHHNVDEHRSSFESSDPMLNAIWELAKRSAMLGSHEQFVDTPTREQGQFAYDAYMTSMAAMKLFGERDLTQQALRDFAQSQTKFHADTGKINAVYPNGHGDGKRDIPDWTQSWVFWVWAYYQETGDRELVGDVLEQVIRVGEYVKRAENPSTGLIDLGNDPGYPSGIVDWPERYGYDRKTTQRTVMSINAYLDYLYVAQLTRVLGRRDVEARFQGYAHAIVTAIQEQLWDDGQTAYVDGLYANGSRSAHASQQANAMMLALGLATGERKHGAMAATQRAGHRTSPLLIRFLIQAYGNHDEDEALMEYLLNPNGRNWAYIINDGGTFTYESWEGRRRPRESSESHPFGAYGAVIALQEYILGVKNMAPQFERMQIRPHPGDLRFARGTIPTQRGEVAVAWEADRQTGGFRMNVKIPVNTRADVHLPRGTSAGTAVILNGTPLEGTVAGNYLVLENVGSGEYEFVR